MFKYLVNPSRAPKHKRKNPELLIVNPYSLGEDREKQKMRAKMAKKNRRYRKNPSLAEIKHEFVGDNFENVKEALVMAAAGGFSLAIGSAVVGARFGESTAAKGLVAILSGVAGGVTAKVLGEKLNISFLRDHAASGAMGAMVLGLWTLIQAPVENAAATVLTTAGVAPPAGTAGWGSWTKEFDTPALSGLGQSYYDEFTRGVSPGMNGLGQPVVAASDLSNPHNNPFLHGYEPMGDIMNSQRLGSFEAEPGLGAFVPENANPRDQQVADVMKNASGAYGGYEGAFDPFIES